MSTTQRYDATQPPPPPPTTTTSCKLSTAAPFILIGTPHSYFTGKLRSYLQVKGIPFEEQLATPEQYEKVIVPYTQKKMIPVLVAKDEDGKPVVLQDTTFIIRTLERALPLNKIPILPPGPLQQVTSHLMELFADEWMILAGMHYRWHKPADNEAQVVSDFAHCFNPTEPDVKRAKRTIEFFRGTLPLLGIDIHNQTCVETLEEQTHEILRELNAHFTTHSYLYGQQPSLADVAFMGPLYAHLFRDVHSGRILVQQYGYIVAWITRMLTPQLQWHSQSAQYFLAEDAVPPVIQFMLRICGQDMFYYCRQVDAAVVQWYQEQGQPAPHLPMQLPRSVGPCSFHIHSSSSSYSGTRLSLPYVCWMYQLAVETYQQLSLLQQQQQQLSKWLGEPLQPLQCHYDFREHQLWLVSITPASKL